jgi:hypothetical protein
MGRDISRTVKEKDREQFWPKRAFYILNVKNF